MSVKMSEAFPSNYVKAADLKGQSQDMKIRAVEMEDLGQGSDKDAKPVVYFHGRDKGLVLNKTNANSIVKAYGDDSNNWTDKAIVIFPTEVDFRGDTVPAIRVRIPEASPVGEDPNDEINF